MLNQESVCAEQEIDGETILSLTERMIERLFPTMKQQALFMRHLASLRPAETTGTSAAVTPSGTTHESAPSSSVGNTPCETSETAQCPSTPTSAVWPARYRLPQFPPAVKQLLDTQDPNFKRLGKSPERASLIQALFDHITSYTWYPSRKQYTDVFVELTNKYPFLRETSGSGYDTILECLRNKMKKERQALTSLDEIASVRVKFSHIGSGRKRAACSLAIEDSSVELVRKIRKGADDALDDEGEDERSIAAHLKDIQTEMAKLRPDFSLVLAKLKQTASYRLQMGLMTTKATLDQFSWLTHPKLLLAEANLRFRVDFDKTFCSKFSPMTQKVISAVRKQQKLAPVVIKIIQYVDELTDEDSKLRATFSAAVLLLPLLFREDTNLLYVVDKDPSAVQPCIIAGGCKNGNPLEAAQLTVKMDGIEVVAGDPVTDISLAFSCLMAVYFVYSVQYPDKLKNTMAFCEHYVFGLSSNKVSTTVQRVHNLLN